MASSGRGPPSDFAREVAVLDPADDTAWNRLVSMARRSWRSTASTSSGARGSSRATSARLSSNRRTADAYEVVKEQPPRRSDLDGFEEEQPRPQGPPRPLGPMHNTHPYVPDDFRYGVTVSHCEPEIRNGFLRKVYGLLSAQLLATIALALWFMLHAPTRGVVLKYSGLTIVTALGSFCFLFACFFYKDKYPHNLGLLSGFTLCIGYSVATTCALYMESGYGYVVFQAFLLTALVSLSLTAFTLRSGVNFEFLGNGLYAGLLALLSGYLLCWLLTAIFGITAFTSLLGFALGVAGAGIFSLYIVYDTWLISERMTPDMYIVAAIDLYLDVINLFLNLMRCLLYCALCGGEGSSGGC